MNATPHVLISRSILEDLQRDAARYRWLRDGANDIFAIQDLGSGESINLYDETLDKYIDLEMTK